MNRRLWKHWWVLWRAASVNCEANFLVMGHSCRFNTLPYLNCIFAYPERQSLKERNFYLKYRCAD